jgi:hypothetical protein
MARHLAATLAPLLLGGPALGAQPAPRAAAESVTVTAVSQGTGQLRLVLPAGDAGAGYQIHAARLQRRGDTLTVSVPATIELRDEAVRLTVRAAPGEPEMRLAFTSRDGQYAITAEGPAATFRRERPGAPIALDLDARGRLTSRRQR